MTEPVPPSPSATLEIAARLVKLVLFFGSALVWVGYALGAYSIYQLWTVDRKSEWLASNVDRAVSFGWYCIGFIVLVRIFQVAVGWAVLTPIEAKIQGVNLRSPEVASELRSTSAFLLVSEAFTIAGLIAVPLLISHFRYGQ